MLSLFATMLSVLSVGAISEKENACEPMPLFRSSLTSLLLVLYYAMLRAVLYAISFLMSSTPGARYHELNLLPGANPDDKDAAASHYTIEEGMEDAEPDCKKEGVVEEKPCKARAACFRAYALGVAAWCLVIGVQTVDAFMTSMLCISFVGISIRECISPPAATVWTRIICPLALFLITAAVALVAVDSGSVPQSPVHACIGVSVPAIGSLVAKYMQDESVAETLNLGAPVLAMMGILGVGASFRMDIGCLADHFVDPVLKMAHTYPTSLLLVSPILYVCTLTAILSATARQRSIDVACSVVSVILLRQYSAGGMYQAGLVLAVIGIALVAGERAMHS